MFGIIALNHKITLAAGFGGFCVYFKRGLTGY